MSCIQTVFKNCFYFLDGIVSMYVDLSDHSIYNAEKIYQRFIQGDSFCLLGISCHHNYYLNIQFVKFDRSYNMEKLIRNAGKPSKCMHDFKASPQQTRTLKVITSASLHTCRSKFKDFSKKLVHSEMALLQY